MLHRVMRNVSLDLQNENIHKNNDEFNYARGVTLWLDAMKCTSQNQSHFHDLTYHVFDNDSRSKVGIVDALMKCDIPSSVSEFLQARIKDIRGNNTVHHQLTESS